MTRDAIIGELTRSRFVEHYAAQFMGRADRVYRDDIIAELYLYICELPPVQLVTIHSGGGMSAVRGYISGLIIRQLRSDNSKIFKKYTRHVYTETATDTLWDGAKTLD